MNKVTDDAVGDQTEHKKLYERHRDELSKRQISNAENLDRSILTYSASGLALSLGFLKDFIPIGCATAAWTLYASWIFFTFAITLVIVSYLLSLRVLDLQLNRAERYYLQSDDLARGEQTWIDKAADLVNYWLSAGAFIIALVLTIFFVSVNLGDTNMANKNISRAIAYDGITGMVMQKVQQTGNTGQRGVTGLPMQTTKPSAPVNQVPSPQPVNNKSGANS